MTWSICESELRRSILPANGREREREKKSHGEKESDIALMRYVQATKKRAGEGRKVHFGYSSKDMRGGQRKEGGGKRRRRNAKRKVVFMCGNPHRSLTMRAHRYDARLSLSVTKEHIGASSKEHALGIKEHWRKPASQPASPSCCCSSSSIRRAVAASVYITSRPTYKWSSSRGKGNASAAEKKWLLMTDHK